MLFKGAHQQLSVLWIYLCTSSTPSISFFKLWGGICIYLFRTFLHLHLKAVLDESLVRGLPMRMKDLFLRLKQPVSSQKWMFGKGIKLSSSGSSIGIGFVSSTVFGIELAYSHSIYFRYSAGRELSPQFLLGISLSSTSILQANSFYYQYSCLSLLRGQSPLCFN